ncbi:MAG: hypothetical protein FWB85_02205 [Chitinispirillia bacterium]|nr:hypothetical protein [Chitinispirillia bacterium]MCL2241219.1 hypothetical protein [Chitinispirillia bacterium]
MMQISKTLFLLTAIIALTASVINANVIADSSTVRQDSTAALSAGNIAADSSGSQDSTALPAESGIAADSSAAQDRTAVLTDGNIRPGTLTHQDTASQASKEINGLETSAAKLDINPDAKPKTRPDTSSKISGAYWGFGIGLSVGSIPVFDLWRNALPNTMPLLGITPDFGSSLVQGDTLPLRYSVSEPPDQFSFTLPFCISLHNIKEKSATAFALSFYQNSKQFQSIFQFTGDSLGRRVSIYETLSYYSLSIEAAYMREIPPVFFSIDGSQRSYLSMTICASPINTFTRDHGVKNEAPKGDPRMQALADSVSKNLAPKLTANGMSLSWRLGICAIRNQGQGSGLEIGLYYSGSYAASFQSEGAKITTGQIDPKDKDAGKPLSFLSNRIEFKATFLMSSNRDKLVTQ